MTRLLLDTTFLIDAEHDEELLDGLIDDDDAAVAAITVAEPESVHCWSTRFVAREHGG